MTFDPGPTSYRATTSDGWRLALARHRPAAPARQHPVLCLHGLGANSRVWDLAPELSIARRLGRCGFDVWTGELRGHGASDRPARGTGRAYGWSLDDHLDKDLPALVSLVLAESGAARLHLVGHSLGGILLYCYLGTGGAARVRSGVAMGASLDYSRSSSRFHAVAKLRRLGRLLPFIPLDRLSPLTTLVCRLSRAAERFYYWPPNMDPEAARSFHRRGSHALSTAVLIQLASAFDPGGLRSSDGRRAFLNLISACEVPVLAVAGEQDRQCPPEAARATVEAMPRGRARLVTLGRSFGHVDHYGHYDLLAGRRAASEVHPLLTDWLTAHDG
jgi:pimeloyl-ACP methyl ester carboxylesterase